MEQITKKTSILFNQSWIDKAIEEGHMEFLPVKKFPGKSIGEHIEIKYNQLDNEEFYKNFHNHTLEEYYHITETTKKITEENSILLRKRY